MLGQDKRLRGNRKKNENKRIGEIEGRRQRIEEEGKTSRETEFFAFSSGVAAGILLNLTAAKTSKRKPRL